MAGDGDYRCLVRAGLADKVQFSALLWPSCAKSGILYLHGGQRETGIPEPHEPGHIRERLKEVRATHARAKKSGPLTPPCPKRSRWRCGVLPKQEARGSRCPRRCRGRARVHGFWNTGNWLTGWFFVLCGVPMLFAIPVGTVVGLVLIIIGAAFRGSSLTVYVQCPSCTRTLVKR